MAKCGKKAKNACKLCLQPVTQKTGLQCQGACLAWVHYSCLNYTPGRIRDIKTGLIKVTCPCPDCNTKYPKEYRTDETFSCTNQHCPANHPPKCENLNCPINIAPQGIPMSQCGLECKKQKVNQTQTDARNNPPNFPPHYGFRGSRECPSACPSSGDVPGDMKRKMDEYPSLAAVEQMCNTVGQLTTQINDLMNKMKQAMMEQQGSKGGGGGCNPKNQICAQKGPKSKCPKPCHCPNNPAARK